MNSRLRRPSDRIRSELTERVVAESRGTGEGLMSMKAEYVNMKEQSLLIMYTLIKRAQRILGLPSSPNILDVGCGDGVARAGLIRSFGNKYIGIDRRRMLEAPEKGILCMELADCPLDWNGKVDLLFCSRVLEESESIEIDLLHVFRLLSEKGLVAHISYYDRGVSSKYPANRDLSEWVGLYDRLDLVPVSIEFVRLREVELHMICVERGRFLSKQ